MMAFAIVLFWFSIFLIFYAFVGYPLFLALAVLLKSKRISNFSNSNYPNVTLLISAYNEEKIIVEKLKNTLELEYPKDKLEILVVSDASTDNTDDVVKAFSQSNVKLFRQEDRRGKTAALNSVVPVARGGIVVFF